MPARIDLRRTDDRRPFAQGADSSRSTRASPATANNGGARAGRATGRSVGRVGRVDQGAVANRCEKSIGGDSLVRVTVTIRADLLEEIDRVERNRSRFIAEAVEHELQRRRRAALLQSAANPHPDTTALADIGLGEWVRGLPEENDLVDLSAGTPVRWVEGRGWVEEPA